ncbi:MAG TPA: porin family protein [Bacteroidales bacterium]|nr:porin family protein [Bacteroidales bacterium]HPI67609.1 porin family protein [Bacteroidales bacterium]HPR72086.1 porin family protein [Bacteroidales bacterium]
MSYFRQLHFIIYKSLLLTGLIILPLVSDAQPGGYPGGHPGGIFGLPPMISFSIHLDPVISWFSTDVSAVRNQGARPGFRFGISCNRYFSPNYSFSTGIDIISSGGRLVNNTPILFELVNHPDKLVEVDQNEPVVYRLQYLSVPLGLKLQTNQIGYYTFFSDIGLDPKVLIAGKADIPSLYLKSEKAVTELRKINLSYHIIAGIEYSLGGSTAAIIGLGFENNFLDATRDLNDQPQDKVSHKLFSFRFGVIF